MSTLLYRGGKWEHSGVVQPLGEVVGIRRDFDRKITHVVLKVRGHSVWSGRGSQTYAGAEYQFYAVRSVEAWDNGVVHTMKVDRIMDVPLRGETLQVQDLTGGKK